MKKIISILSVAFLFSAGLQAQAFLNRLGNAAANAAEKAIIKRTEKEVDKAVNKAADKVLGTEESKKSSKKQAAASQDNFSSENYEDVLQSTPVQSGNSGSSASTNASVGSTSYNSPSNMLLDLDEWDFDNTDISDEEAIAIANAMMEDPTAGRKMALETAESHSLKPYICITPGAELTFKSYDAKGKEIANGGSVQKVVSATGMSGNYDITMQLIVPGLNPITAQTKVTGGNAIVSLGGGATVSLEGDVPFIPERMAVGMELDCGVINAEVMGMKTVQTITSNKVVGREELTTDAGTFKCYIVEQVYTASVMGIKTNAMTRTWYARGLGAIKIETMDKNGKTAQVQLLTGLKGM